MKVDLEELEKLEANATHSPWDEYAIYSILRHERKHGIVSDEALKEAEDAGRLIPAEADAAFICAMRNALPSLIAELRAARTALELLNQYVESARSFQQNKGGQHTNGPPPILYQLPPSGLKELAYLVRLHAEYDQTTGGGVMSAIDTELDELHEWRTGKRRVFWRVWDGRGHRYTNRREAMAHIRIVKITDNKELKLYRVTVRPKTASPGHEEG